MAIPKQGYVAPTHPTVQRRANLVDREGFDEMQCDLDYVAQTTLPEDAWQAVLKQMAIVASVGTALTWAIGEFVLPLVYLHMPIGYLVPVVLLLAVLVALKTGQSFEKNLTPILQNVWLTVWFVAAVAAIPMLYQTKVAMLWLLVVAMPVAVHIAHRFTTFGVHWITGHPLGDGTVMIHCRELWRYRYEGVSTSVPEEVGQSQQEIQCWNKMLWAVRSHDYGFLWCYASVLAALAITWLRCGEERLSSMSLQFTVSILLALLIAAIIRCDGRLPLRLLGGLLLRWFYYNTNKQATPWMFQSPCGNVAARSRWALATVGLMAVAMNNLSCGYAVLAIPVAKTVAVFYPELTFPILTLTISTLLCIAVPLTILALLLCIIAGPALKAFDELYSN